MSIIKSAYLELVKVLSPVRHARMIGVSLGDNCLVYRSMEWPSEPYLVTIGNNVQLTKGVAIHTHGEGIGEKEKKQCLLTMDESMFLKK